MNIEEAMAFKPHIDRKLSAEGIDVNNIQGATEVLSRCVMGSKLVNAFLVIYEQGGNHNV